MSGIECVCLDDGMIVVGRYVAGNSKQPQWSIENDEISCQYEDRRLTVGVDGPMTAGAKCTALVDNSNNCWLFDQQ